MATSFLNLFLMRLVFPLLLSGELICADWTFFVKAGCWLGTGDDSAGLSCDFLGDCDQQFLFCLRQYDTSGTSEVCPFGKVQTGEFDVGDSFCFGDSYIDLASNVPNPIAFSNDGSYPGSIQLFVNVNDVDSDADDLIANIFIDLNLDPSESFTSLGTYTGTGSGGSITLQFKVECHDNYYDLDCGTFCMDTNNSLGHYTCDSNGEIICMPGWTEPSTNCVTPVCIDCHPIGGNCSAPGSCVCQQGWSGDQCNLCQTMDGCANGYCTMPDECICSPNWGGTLCDLDLIPCETQSPCLNGGSCTNNGAGGYTCACATGYIGVNCETQETTPCQPNPCKNGGVCSADGTNGVVKCSGCQNGCSGSLCDNCGNICSNSPCENGGTCQVTVSGFECVCQDGYFGLLCDITPCDLDPCVNGSTCVNLNGEALCACSAGLGDVCNKVCSPSPCLNGGQCFVTAGGLSFACSCLKGFSGEECQDLTDSTGATKFPSTSLIQLSLFPSSTNDMVGDDENPTTLIVIVAGAVVGLIILLIIVIILVGCTLLILKKQKTKPAIVQEMDDINQSFRNDDAIGQSDDLSIEFEKRDLNPPGYDDL